jgi:hypothetical protein
MTGLRSFLLPGVALVLLMFGLGAMGWWYLFGPNEVDSAELVPANTLVFATIPNAATILESYQTSQLKTLVDSPNAKPLQDAVVNLLGEKNLGLIEAFLPNLSGQSFVAITHFDYDHPEEIGLIAAMKPKAGLGDFDAFVEKLKGAWPDVLKQGKTGTGTVAGVDYQWIQGPGAKDKICVARVKGWIVTSWGEASLQDWLERFQKRASTSSLAQDVDYRESRAAVGDNPMTLVYVNFHSLMDLFRNQLTKTDPAAGDYMGQKLDAWGGAALATRFENGEIVDRFSLLIPRPAQIDSGMAVDPCPFDTLKFTGPDTRFYWASSVNWKRYYGNLKGQLSPSSVEHKAFNPILHGLLVFLQTWAHNADLDTKQNIADTLGPEISVQVEWSADSTYPEAGLFVKLDKPDDFKPTITAIIESARKAYATSAVIKELDSNGQKFASLEFVQPSPISPTITEDGPYFGVFLTENQAVRSFQRDPTIGLSHNADFKRQTGDKLQRATQVCFLDSPRLLDRAYRTAMPYLSIVSMFNKNLADLLKGRDLPPDLTWLAPMGTWSCVTTPDEDGIRGYSVSGIGNQGILLTGAAGGTAGILQGMGLLPKPPAIPGTASVSSAPPVSPPPAPPPVQPNPTESTNAAPALPNASGTTSTSVIYITAKNEIFFDTTPVSADQFGDFLKSKKITNQDLKLTVKVDRDASPDILSTVMDAGATAGFGVLPYAYTADAASATPAGNSNAAPTRPLEDAATNAAPITNSNVDATPTTPGLQPQ